MTSNRAETRVLIVDDAKSFRAAMAQVVEAVPHFRVVAVADTGEEALRVAGSTPIDLTLMDVVMPGMGGVQAARRIHNEHPDISVMLVSAYSLDELPPLPTPCSWCRFCAKDDFGPDALEEWWRSQGG
jgi:DNA-binding NarL/FixJ family response regulator